MSIMVMYWSVFLKYIWQIDVLTWYFKIQENSNKVSNCIKKCTEHVVLKYTKQILPQQKWTVLQWNISYYTSLEF